MLLQFYLLIYALNNIQSKVVGGQINLTCDAWQVSNTDSYSAVTGHWIEEATKNEWVLQNALLGFTHMNTTHNGKCLGQALYKICLYLNIVKKVCILLVCFYFKSNWDLDQPHHLRQCYKQ